MSGGWRFWIDRGGTFTDVVARRPDGSLQVAKVLSLQPDRPGDPAVAAVRRLLDVSDHAPLPPALVEEVRLGTTVATNALLERRTEPVLLLLNRGFADLPWIGDQHRPDLFALCIERPELPSLRVVEVEGRLAVDGSEVEPLRLDDDLEERVRRAQQDGYRSCAVALLHGYRHPAHELRLGDWLQERGFGAALLSHRLSRQSRLVPRCATAVVEAAIRPVLDRYLLGLRRDLGTATPLRVMTSSGALHAPALLLAKDTILSGPAGGMVGAVAVARAAGFGSGPILGFDMGGTSTDVFHCDAGVDEALWERSGETEIAGLRLQAAMLPIHTVAAGGGSVLHLEGGRLQVGPLSAGADPGPACYGRGGPLTVTDANLLLGRLPAAALPAVFGPRGDRPADAAVVERLFHQLAERLAAEGGVVTSGHAVALGALGIAVERMAEAIRRISIQRGHDIRDAVLVAFGGAGGQHACAVAASLGIARVLLHPLAGVLSAYGIGRARQRLLRERPVRVPLGPEMLSSLERERSALASEARHALVAAVDLAPDREPTVQVRLELRDPGTDRGLEVGWTDGGAGSSDAALVSASLRRAYEQKHRERFGYVVEGGELVVETLRVEVIAPAEEGVREAPLGAPPFVDPGEGAPGPDPGVSALADGALWPLWLPDRQRGGAPERRQVILRRRECLAVGEELVGPALVVEPTGTTVLEPHWRARVLPGGELLLEYQEPAPQAADPAPAPAAGADPVRLELWSHRFSAVAEQMGVRLQQSSRSVNIRERLDFSCALFDGQGRLVANAPHIPVHLGSMGESVNALRQAIACGERAPLGPGDAVASNDPFHGGTHLPDITVISAVFGPGGGSPVGWVASRGHHADVGGITPGSMPARSRSIEEEGLLLDNVPLLTAGRLEEDSWRLRLAAGAHPVRNPSQLLADLQAQVAANRLGGGELERLLARHGTAEVLAFMAHVQSNAAEAVRQVIDRLQDGSHALELDDGAWIRVAVRIDRQARRARVDFSGTSPQQPGNGNAPLAITRAVVLYVFRCLVGRPIPLNAGCFDPIDLVVPAGSLLCPLPPAAVVAGNVETSQAVANALFGALGVMAAAQGTMNNLSFGDEACQYYETICGGTGAGVRPDGSGFAGASAVQSHMTNSRLTDPEILEDRFPVRLLHFGRRSGSGGVGHWPGGEGVVREILFLRPLTVSLLSGSRRVPPFGLAGGGPGAVGLNVLEHADGSRSVLGGAGELAVEVGDRLRIETPGGGAYGPPPAEEALP